MKKGGKKKDFPLYCGGKSLKSLFYHCHRAALVIGKAAATDLEFEAYAKVGINKVAPHAWLIFHLGHEEKVVGEAQLCAATHLKAKVGVVAGTVVET